MQLSEFDFELPAHLIAQSPVHPRDHARLLIYDRSSKTIKDDYFYNLDKYLVSGSTLVLNDSKVEKSRLRFGKTEIFVVDTINPTTIKAMVKPGRRFKKDAQVELANNICAKVIDIDEQGLRTLQLSLPVDDEHYDAYRLTPLPPYIAQNEELSEEYQTVYADPLGSKAAPTAGLHFTKPQLDALAVRHSIAKLTLHVGLGTFAPVKTDDVSKHHMHSEEFMLSAETADILNNASHVTAVGTTSLRTLESLARPFYETSGATDIFITPGFKFQNTDSLITNFHLPKSTLLMLVAAFMGSSEQMKSVYDHAIKTEYRFYSFGDAMLII